METKNYIKGSAKAVSTQYGEILNLSIRVEDLVKIQNEKGYASITVAKRKEPSQYWDTHSMVENTYKKRDQDTVYSPHH